MACQQQPIPEQHESLRWQVDRLRENAHVREAALCSAVEEIERLKERIEDLAPKSDLAAARGDPHPRDTQQLQSNPNLTRCIPGEAKAKSDLAESQRMELERLAATVEEVRRLKAALDDLSVECESLRATIRTMVPHADLAKALREADELSVRPRTSRPPHARLCVCSHACPSM